jgi:hypothetical protein
MEGLLVETNDLKRKAGIAAARVLEAKTAAQELEAEFARCNRDETEVAEEDLMIVLMTATLTWPEEWPPPVAVFFKRRLAADNAAAAVAMAAERWPLRWPKSIAGFLVGCFGEENLERLLQGAGLMVSVIGVNTDDGWIIAKPAVVAEVRKQWRDDFANKRWGQ